MAESELQVGAQKERDAFKAYLKRRLDELNNDWDRDAKVAETERHLGWVEGRVERYDKAPGGLGKKKARTASAAKGKG
jgi:hypothetical protein